MAPSERVLNRLMKLLALADSANGHEATTAAQMAESLMEKHGLTMVDIAAHKPVEFYELPVAGKGFEACWKFSLITATARFCGCEAIGLQAGRRRYVRLSGEKASVDCAAELFESLLATMKKLEKLEASMVSDLNLPISSSPRQYADSFRRGAVVSIIETMIVIDPTRFGHGSSKGDAMRDVPGSGEDRPKGRRPEGRRPEVKKWNWLSRIWPWSVRKNRALPPIAELIPVAKASSQDRKKDHEEKVKSKYAPRTVGLDLENPSDHGAYWRGYELARETVTLQGDRFSKEFSSKTPTPRTSSQNE